MANVSVVIRSKDFRPNTSLILANMMMNPAGIVSGPIRVKMLGRAYQRSPVDTTMIPSSLS